MSEHKPYPQEHPHFIQGQEFERERIIAAVNEYIESRVSGSYSINRTELFRIIKEEKE